MTALEKAARAVAAEEGHTPWSAFTESYQDECRAKTRAVLMAVRDEMSLWGEFDNAVTFLTEILAEKPE